MPCFALITESIVCLGNGVWELMCWCAYVGSYAEVNDSLAGRVAFKNSFDAAFTGGCMCLLKRVFDSGPRYMYTVNSMWTFTCT